jgi:M6 family metalloprotease-like protein
MRKNIVTFLVSFLLFSIITTPINAAVKAGANCTKAGATSTVNGIKYTCIKSGKNLVWNKGVVIKVEAPKPSATSESMPGAQNKLAIDSRITQSSALTAIDICKTEDITYEQNSELIFHKNGFPRPTLSVSGKKSAKILVIPLAFKDLPFYTEKILRGQNNASDLELVNQAIPLIKDGYKQLSGGRFQVSIDVLPLSEWWRFESNHPFSATWGVPNIPKVLEIIQSQKSTFNFDTYDTYAFITGNGMPGQASIGTAQAGFAEKVRSSKSGYVNLILMTGSLSNINVWIHELGHAFFAYEDLYLFNEANSSTPRQRNPEISVPNKWDLMADATGIKMLQWNRLLAGWLDDSEIRCLNNQTKSVHYISKNLTSKDPKLLTINLAPGVTLAAEARAYTTEQSALLLYTINTYIPHGEGPILSQNVLIPKGKAKSWLGWTFNVLDSNTDGILVEAIKTDIDKFVPPAVKPQPGNQQQPGSTIQVGKGDVVESGFLKARATWEVKGHQSYRLYVTAMDDNQKVYFESGYVNDSRSPLVVEISGLVCGKQLRTITEFYSEKDGKGERVVIQNTQLYNLSCEDNTKKP